ncbi:MAG: hypothetical protein MZV65_53180 [Chromatiales bacterium]|nr:hypothetical protein [Chromatiales bacterium]
MSVEPYYDSRSTTRVNRVRPIGGRLGGLLSLGALASNLERHRIGDDSALVRRRTSSR